MRTVEERIWEKIDKSGEHWIWKGSRNREGYPNIKVEGKHIPFHKILFPGEITSFSCGRKDCLRHLQEGRRPNPPVGEDVLGHKLNEADVREIRKLSDGGWGIRKIQRQFNQVSLTTIRKIVKREDWRHIQ